MKLIGQNEIATLTGCDKKTVKSRLAGVVAKPGPNRANLYDSTIALRKVMGLDHQEGDPVTPAQAQLQLTIARKQEIELSMEVMRRERIPIDVLNGALDQVFGAINGIIKANADRIGSEGVADIQSQIRDVPSKLKW